MPQSQLSMKEKNKTTPLTIQCMAVYAQSKIIEAFDQEGDAYYIFFYKDHYLNIVKAVKLLPHSHITRAFNDGIVFQAPHPLIDSLCPDNNTFKKQSFNHLFKGSDDTFTPHEKALIATFFESFIAKEKLFKFIQSLFYQHRRDGKVFESYKIVRILGEFSPNNDWTYQFQHKLEFNKYDDWYEQLDASLSHKDPLYYETYLFKQRKHDESFQALQTFLHNQARWRDQIALYINRLVDHPDWDDYQLFKQLMSTHFSTQENVAILEDVYNHSTHFPALIDDLLTQYMQLNQPEQALNLIIVNGYTLTPDQAKTLANLVESVDLTSESINLDKMNQFLVTFFPVDAELSKQLLHQSVSVLMARHSLAEVRKWLEPLESTSGALSTIRKLDSMMELTEDPDPAQQQRLGELYFEFNQLDEAIQCFSWSGELNDNDPSPVYWLYKSYELMKQDDKADAYKQLYYEMKKNS
ncbi:lipopolysaccharide assembly protein LapB [Thalassobacillus sp. CUG 92003]|uniref:tetratricopeptide repeat protein n=1 Tax=Thalassobacillus sp. CUG 92003 TaxID=2736641 RepID=UPI0015E688F1|nr:hypothetical protein [Thalassobacillus sp. CUG 92003]